MTQNMLDLRYVVDNLAEVRASIGRRSAKDAALLDPISALAQRRLALIQQQQAKAAERNSASKEMSRLDKSSADFAQRRAQLKQLSVEVKRLEQQLAEVQQQVHEQLARVPNLVAQDVPQGNSEQDNVLVSSWGEAREYDFEVKPHDELGVALGILDFERAAKLSGARFTIMLGAGARLERALIGFMLDLHTGEHGYTEVLPPFMVRREALFGTGQLPKFESDLFKTSKRDPDKSYDLYLNPTAEVPLTNMHAREILDAPLPLALTAYTPCFRSEAGSYGQDVRGMIRQHQFDKVELVRLCRPEDSAAQLELLTRHAETVLEKLGLHYRRVLLCTGDLGFSATKTYDLEVWLPAQKRFREISSCSNCGDFQARRAKIRYREKKGTKARLVHTLNGSGLAVGRTVIAILEQYQQADGSVVVPEVLRARMGCERITKG